MPFYILDSNIWIDLSQGKIACSDITGRTTVKVALAPFTLTELMRGIVKGGETYFQRNRSMVKCMASCDILELPKVFIYKTLWNVAGGVSKVQPGHYKTLLEMVTSSGSHKQFLRLAEAPRSVWKRMSELDSIHEGVLDKELRSLVKLAKGASVKTLHVNMARTNSLSGIIPEPDSFQEKFSAAIEFLRSCVIQVRRGANALKNNRGLYVDNQLFFYLAAPDAVIVSNEDFSGEIKVSPQKNRIIKFSDFLLL